MNRAQLFTTDLLLSFLIVIATFLVFTNLFYSFESNTSSTIDDVKLQVLAADLAAAQYYTGSDLGLINNLQELGYSETGTTCFYSTRGTYEEPVRGGVCR